MAMNVTNMPLAAMKKHMNPPTEPVNLSCYKTQTQACTTAKLK